MFIQFVIATIAGASFVFWLPNVDKISALVQWTIIVVLFLVVLNLPITNYISLLLSRFFRATSKPSFKLYSKPIDKKYHRSTNTFFSFFIFTNFQSYQLLVKPTVFNLINICLGFLLGILLVVWQVVNAPQPEEKWFNQKSVFIGEVISFPVEEANSRLHKVTMLFKVKRIIGKPYVNRHGYSNLQSWPFRQPVLKVSWYLNAKQKQELIKSPRLGETWLFYGKLKTNHASRNFFAHDYETWLLQKGIAGKLSVSGVKKFNDDDLKALVFHNTASSFLKNAMLVGPSSEAAIEGHASIFSSNIIGLFNATLNSFRNQTLSSLKYLTQNSDFQAIYTALLMGEKSSISSQEWKLFQETGTIHLMAISGLHMSIMALIGFLFAKGLWWLLVYKQRTVIFPVFAAVTSFVFATYYLLISGAAIPTQRAWIMVSTVIVFLVLRRSFQPMTALAMAALLVLLWDVKALLSSGFWLSFLAVWLIFSILELIKPLGKLHKTLLVQVVLSLGLLPVIAWLYYAVPIYSLIANLVAVPFITIIGLPLLLVAQVLGFIFPETGIRLFLFSDELWRGLFAFLQYIQTLPNSLSSVGQFDILQLVIFYVGWLVLLKVFKATLFKNFSTSLSAWLSVTILGLYISVSTLLIYLTQSPSIEKQGQVEVTVFDVGQGQAIAFKTRNHLVVYDAGAKWGSKTDAAKVAMLPYFKAQLIDDIDLLVISHSDMDHAGGTKTLLNELNVHQKVSGQPKKLNDILNRNNLDSPNKLTPFTACSAGQEWEFDKVKFSILSPAKSAENLTDNDWSCVLRVSTGQHSILVMGDLSIKAEKSLLNHLQKNKLKIAQLAFNGLAEKSISKEGLTADILIAGHHGSRYSTSQALLESVNPNMIVFSAGYLNRYGFPNTDVLQRIKDYEKGLNLKSLGIEFSPLESNAKVTKNTQSIKWWNTACSGALRFRLTENGVSLENEARKTNARWYHHRCSSRQKGRFYQ